MKEKQYTYNIEYKAKDIPSDIAQFDTLFEPSELAIVEIINEFLKFIQEYSYKDVEILSIECLNDEWIQEISFLKRHGVFE